MFGWLSERLDKVWYCFHETVRETLSTSLLSSSNPVHKRYPRPHFNRYFIDPQSLTVLLFTPMISVAQGLEPYPATALQVNLDSSKIIKFCKVPGTDVRRQRRSINNNIIKGWHIPVWGRGLSGFDHSGVSSLFVLIHSAASFPRGLFFPDVDSSSIRGRFHSDLKRPVDSTAR